MKFQILFDEAPVSSSVGPPIKIANVQWQRVTEVTENAPNLWVKACF